MSTSISLVNLTKSFDARRPAVDDATLRIESGELFFLLGPSGCGKTTLLRMVAGFIEPTSGRIEFETAAHGVRDVTRLPPNKRRTGMVFQSYALWPHMSVEANVAFGLNVRRVGATERKRRVAEALELVRMSDFAARKPNQLSGGQQQRVALARALVIRPDVLLLDEPLSNLDARLRLELRAEIRRICKEAGPNAEGMTTIYVTHDQKEALSMADRVAIMRDGRTVQTGVPPELYRRPASKFVAEFLGETNFLPGVVTESGQSLRIATSAGELHAAASTSFNVGESVVCSVRPEAFRVVGTETVTGNALRGTVTQTTYLGEMAQLDVRLDGADGERGAAEIKVSLMNPPLPSPASAARLREKIVLSIDPADVVVLRAE